MSPPATTVDPATRKAWLPPLRYSLPVIMLASGLVLICVETALFLAFQERRTIDIATERAMRDGARIARMAGQFLTAGDKAALEREMAATRSEAGVSKVELQDASPQSLRAPQITRTGSGTDIVAIYSVATASPALLTITFDLRASLADARRLAWMQALFTGGVLALGSLLLWIALDSAIARRAERIVAGARAMAAGEAPGPPIGGEDELAQIDHALREAHALIHRQAADLQERTQERSRLEQEIIQISEREQRRIGQDLHDDVCQRLAAVKMKIQDHEEKLASSAPALLNDAGAIATDLSAAIHITRALARGLSPVEASGGGLAMALRGLARDASAVFGIECHFDGDEGIPALPHQTANQLFRIAQECVSNAARHARATHVGITLRHTFPALTMRVANDGSPKPSDDAEGEGMGLSIMRHRAESIGATLEFESSPPDAVTAVRCTLLSTTGEPVANPPAT